MASLLMAGPRAGALTIEVIGNAGVDGAPGVDGTGGDPADAIAISADPANEAYARSGRGGDGGIGANGGAGGDASALAETNVAGPASASSHTRAGRGGSGVGGGAGGGASSEARATGTSGAQADVHATGGAGGSGSVGGAGGGASAVAEAEASAGDASASSSLGVVGGPGGTGSDVAGDGGAADGRASARAANEAWSAIEVRGGQGGSASLADSGAGGDGGAAAAEAIAFGTTAAAFATALGGRGGVGSGAGTQAGDGGSAGAVAVASGSAGSEAHALARGGSGGRGEGGAEPGRGGDATLADAASGADDTALTLDQRAEGGAGGWSLTWVPGRGYYVDSGTGGRGGDASSEGSFENSVGGDLFVTLSAIGGDGGSGLTYGDGGDAHVGGSATSVGIGGVTLVASARSGSGYREGALRLDPLVATAAGSGNARVELDAARGEARSPGYSPIPSAPLSLYNAVDAIASTCAEISLVQSATSSGGATSVLDVAKSAALLDLEANALGGVAHVSVSGSNGAGALGIGGEAVAGRSGDAYDASATFLAETSGDGHDIEIGSASRRTGARGSEWSEGRGGDATVEARATALGNSAVAIDVVAEGGEADWSEPGGYGGNAWTNARGQGAGTQSVTVAATALGGGGGYDWSGPGGDATAEAEAIGLGPAAARATARAGYPGGWREKLIGGGAYALSRATGSIAEAEAVASSSLPFDGEHDRDWEIARIQVEARSSLPGHAAVGASTDLTRFAVAGMALDSDAFVRAAFAPESALLDAALAGNPRAQASLPPARPKLPIALVEIQARSRAGTPQILETSIVLNGSFRSFDDEVKAVQLSFLDPDLDGAALSSLTLRSWDTRDPGDIYEITFASALDALAFLDDGWLSFGGRPSERHLEILLETTGAEGDFFLDLVVAAVPEPSLAALLVLAALAAAGARRVVASCRS